MTTLPPQQVTQLLRDWTAGDQEALERLIPWCTRSFHFVFLLT